MGAGAGRPADRLKAVKNGLRLQKHTHSAAIRVVVHPAVDIKGIGADVVALHRDKPFLPGAAYDAFRKHRLAHGGKESKHVNAHRRTTP